jgi:hypothetical protein
LGKKKKARPGITILFSKKEKKKARPGEKKDASHYTTEEGPGLRGISLVSR